MLSFSLPFFLQKIFFLLIDTFSFPLIVLVEVDVKRFFLTEIHLLPWHGSGC